MQISRVKDNIVTQKGRSDQNLAEAISLGIDQIIQAVTPLIEAYQVSEQQRKEAESTLETIYRNHPETRPEKLKTPKKENPPISQSE